MLRDDLVKLINNHKEHNQAMKSGVEAMNRLLEINDDNFFTGDWAIHLGRHFKKVTSILGIQKEHIREYDIEGGKKIYRTYFNGVELVAVIDIDKPQEEVNGTV